MFRKFRTRLFLSYLALLAILLATFQLHMPLPWVVASALLGSVLMTWAFSTWQFRSIARLSQAARRMASGHFQPSQRPEFEEIGALEESISSMAQDFQASLEEAKSEHILLKATLKGMSEAVFALDRQGRVLLLNPACEAIFGITQDQAQGRPYYETFRNSELTALLERAKQSSQPLLRGEITILSQPERILAVSLATLHGPDPRQDRVIVVLSDITEVKRLMQMRSEFVANVSHELKTPLAAIRASLETLEDGALDDHQVNRDFLAKALRHTQRLSSLIEDVLSLSAIEDKQRRGAQTKAPGSLPESYANAYGLVENKSLLKHLVWKVDLPSNLPKVALDDSALVQIFTNFLDNAVKYSPENAEIRVSARLQGSQVRAEVADQGPGIPLQDQPRLFERFYRVDKARSRELGGTGLGLSIVKHLVEGAGGKVGISSQPGQGSTFWFELPCLE